jgi:hypothetical protein
MLHVRSPPAAVLPHQALCAPQPRLPDIPTDEAVAALGAHPFEGRWQVLLTFSAVDLAYRPGTATDRA